MGDYDDGKYCKVYDWEDFFTTLVQIVLFAFALSSLYLKRLQEVPRRTFRTWFLDVSKQAIGAGYAHVLNMVSISTLQYIMFQSTHKTCKRRRCVKLSLTHTHSLHHFFLSL